MVHGDRLGSPDETHPSHDRGTGGQRENPHRSRPMPGDEPRRPSRMGEARDAARAHAAGPSRPRPRKRLRHASSGPGRARFGSSLGRRSRKRSASRMMRSIMRTLSAGYRPVAVSAESMRASAPSRVAFATSLASARVGRSELTIDSSIWVATITGFPCRRHRTMISFCRTGTRSGADLDPEVPARHHDRIRRFDDFVDMGERFLLLDLRDDERRRFSLPDNGLHAPHVGGAPHERDRDVIDPHREAELEVASGPWRSRTKRPAAAGRSAPCAR